MSLLPPPRVHAFPPTPPPTPLPGAGSGTCVTTLPIFALIPSTRTRMPNTSSRNPPGGPEEEEEEEEDDDDENATSVRSRRSGSTSAKDHAMET